MLHYLPFRTRIVPWGFRLLLLQVTQRACGDSERCPTQAQFRPVSTLPGTRENNTLTEGEAQLWSVLSPCQDMSDSVWP